MSSCYLGQTDAASIRHCLRRPLVLCYGAIQGQKENVKLLLNFGK